MESRDLHGTWHDFCSFVFPYSISITWNLKAVNDPWWRPGFEYNLHVVFSPLFSATKTITWVLVTFINILDELEQMSFFEATLKRNTFFYPGDHTGILVKKMGTKCDNEWNNTKPNQRLPVLLLQIVELSYCVCKFHQRNQLEREKRQCVGK